MILMMTLTLVVKITIISGGKTRCCVILYLRFDEPAGPVLAGLLILIPIDE
jgi:hypothetical protein